MVSLAALWLPIVLSSVIVFIVSALVWMVLPHHKSDWLKLPDEDAAMAALREQGVTPGVYTLPHAASAAEEKSESFQAKVAAGPLAFLHVRPASTVTNMGPQLAMVFANYLVLAFPFFGLTPAATPPGFRHCQRSRYCSNAPPTLLRRSRRAALN